MLRHEERDNFKVRDCCLTSIPTTPEAVFPSSMGMVKGETFLPAALLIVIFSKVSMPMRVDNVRTLPRDRASSCRLN